MNKITGQVAVCALMAALAGVAMWLGWPWVVAVACIVIFVQFA